MAIVNYMTKVLVLEKQKIYHEAWNLVSDKSINKVKKIIDNLNINKACQICDSPPKIIKISKDCSIISHWLHILLIARCIYETVSYCIDKVEFPNYLKYAAIVPMHKKKAKTNKVNDKPVSIPSTFSKLYEKLMYK